MPIIDSNTEVHDVPALLEKILVVDDDPDIRSFCQDSLSNEDYQVCTTATGEEAIELTRDQEFAVVLSDIRMPGMSGLELLSNLKKVDPDQAVIMFSGFGDVDAAVEAMKRGASDYLSKPLILDELKISVRQALHELNLRRENQKLKQELKDSITALNGVPPAIPLLQNIPQDILKQFLDLGKMRRYDEHMLVLPEGKGDIPLLIILEGELSVWQDGAELYRLAKFDCFGEMNIFRPSLRSLSLIAETTVEILIVEREAIISFFNQHEERLFKYFILNSMNSIYTKLRRATTKVIQLDRLLKG
ncbi:MAG: response regulator [bacterium]|nr:response regulator [bacterium]